MTIGEDELNCLCEVFELRPSGIACCLGKQAQKSCGYGKDERVTKTSEEVEVEAKDRNDKRSPEPAIEVTQQSPSRLPSRFITAV
jgi:hypothetical protein